VLFGVQLGGFVMMFSGMQVVTVRHLRMMCSLFVMSGLVVFGGFAMMLRRLLVMMRGVFVMLVDLVVIFAVHRRLPVCFDAAASIAELP
jgi:hypothetical protein